MRVPCIVFCCLAPALLVPACGSDVSCPSGTVKNEKNVCVAKSAIDAMNGDDSDDDRPTDEASSGELLDGGGGDESDACVPTDETCNGLDDDCDGMVDEDVTGDSFVDRDRDGYGIGAVVAGCGGTGYASRNGDCNDDNKAVSPGSSEVCNGVDDDCDANVDEGVRVPLYLDEDGDGHGLATNSDVFCAGQVVAGRVPSSDDCDDKCPTCSPDNTQETLCDGKDDDCDMQIDDGVDQLFAAECDGDGFAAAGAQVLRACVKPTFGPTVCPQGTWTAPGKSDDCNDARSDVSPAAKEVCDGVDNDCNKLVDEAMGSLTSNSLHVAFSPDVDRDGYRQPVEQMSCVAPNADWIPTSAAQGIDCADYDPNAYPGSTHASQTAVSGGTTTTPFDYNCSGADEGPAGGCPQFFVCAAFFTSCWPTKPTCGEASAHRVCSTNLNGELIPVTRTEAPACR